MRKKLTSRLFYMSFYFCCLKKIVDLLRKKNKNNGIVPSNNYVYLRTQQEYIYIKLDEVPCKILFNSNLKGVLISDNNSFPLGTDVLLTLICKEGLNLATAKGIVNWISKRKRNNLFEIGIKWDDTERNIKKFIKKSSFTQ